MQTFIFTGFRCTTDIHFKGRMREQPCSAFCWTEAERAEAQLNLISGRDPRHGAMAMLWMFSRIQTPANLDSFWNTLLYFL